MLHILNEAFIKAQPRVMRKQLQEVVNQLSTKNIIIFNLMVTTNIQNDMSLSEAVGRLRDKFIANYKLNLPSTFWTEKAVLTVISQLLRNSSKLRVTKVIEKVHGKYITHYRCKINYPEPKLITRELAIAFKPVANIKTKGHSLVQHTVPEDILELHYQDELWTAKFRDERLFHLHAFLKFIKNKDKVKANESTLTYKKRLFLEAKLGYNLTDSSIKLCKFYDTRGRGYPKVEFGSFKPYGDHFESRLIELEEAYIVSPKDIEYTKWLLWTDLKGRMPLEQALAEYSPQAIAGQVTKNKNAIANAHSTMLEYKTLPRGAEINVITPNQLGDMLYFNELVKLIREGVGSTSNLLVEVDMTNSGLIHLANACRTPKLMTLANLIDPTTVHDSHTNLTNALVDEIDKQIALLEKAL